MVEVEAAGDRTGQDRSKRKQEGVVAATKRGKVEVAQRKRPSSFSIILIIIIIPSVFFGFFFHFWYSTCKKY
jgi:hypothetical protein